MARKKSTLSANDRLKASWNRVLGVSIFGAVAIEIALLMAGPEFTVPVEYRMVVVADSLQNVVWHTQSPRDDAGQARRAPADATLPRPEDDEADRASSRSSNPATPGNGTDRDPQVPRLLNLRALHNRLHAVYPRALWEVRFENAITVEVSIDDQGTITNLELVEPGLDLAADEAITTLARQLTFSPGRINGTPVPVTALLRLSVEVPVYDGQTDWTSEVRRRRQDQRR